jgi:hypothetical protein
MVYTGNCSGQFIIIKILGNAKTIGWAMPVVRLAKVYRFYSLKFKVSTHSLTMIVKFSLF